jgi:DNA-binding GntR family transcriptional regulator
MLITSWMPVSLFPNLEDKRLEKRSMRFVLQSEYGIEGGSQHKEVEVTALDEEEAGLLNARVGMPALLVTYLSCLPNARPYEYRKMVCAAMVPPRRSRRTGASGSGAGF